MWSRDKNLPHEIKSFTSTGRNQDELDYVVFVSTHS